MFDVVGRLLLWHKSLLVFLMTERLLLSAACILSDGPEKATHTHTGPCIYEPARGQDIYGVPGAARGDIWTSILVGSPFFGKLLGTFWVPGPIWVARFCHRDDFIRPAGSIESLWSALLVPVASRGFLLGFLWGSLGPPGVLLVASLGYLWHQSQFFCFQYTKHQKDRFMDFCLFDWLE